MTPKAVAIRWIDSTTFRNGWTNEVPSDLDCKEIISVGLLAKETEDSYILSIAHADLHGTSMFNDFFTIPKGCVKEFSEMAVKSDKKNAYKKK